MKITFQDQYQIAQETSGVSDSTNTTRFKRDINTGGALITNLMQRQYNKKRLTADLVASQQYYQTSEDALQISQVIVQSSSSSQWRPPLEQVADENQWLKLNQIPINGVPRYYFIRGFDEIGLYPIPSYSATTGIEIWLEPKFNSLSKDDITTGTVTVTNGSSTITHSGTSFTSDMVGRYFSVTDGTDANWYKIGGYTSSSVLTLENYYQGVSGSGRTFKIGEIMDIPEEFLEAPVDYAMYRYFKRKREIGIANDFYNSFKEARDEIRERYSQTTSNQVIIANKNLRPYNPLLDTPLRNNSWT